MRHVSAPICATRDKLTVLDKPALGEVVTVREDLSVREATRLLAQKNILSAPVARADATKDDAWLDKYVVRAIPLAASLIFVFVFVFGFFWLPSSPAFALCSVLY